MPIDREKATLSLDEPVSRVRLVSPARAAALEKLGVRTLRDLLTHFPRSYIDLSQVETCGTARIGEVCTIRGTVHEIKLKKPRYNLKLVEIALVDGTGILIVTCFRQPWLMDQVKAGDAVAVSGKVTFDYGYKRMTNPFIEVIGEGEEVTGSVVPVHPATEKLTAAWVRRIVANGLEAAEGLFDPLPLGLRLRYRLMSRNAALRAIHFPRTMPEADEARRRLVYEELLYLELFLMQEGAARSAGCVPHAHVVDGPRLAAFASSLPFELTGEQQRARDEILSALAAPTVANHMLLGDVGTGKTVVAGHALAAAADSEGQAMLLAPTEVLARQHMEGLGERLEGAGVRVALLTGSTPAGERAAIVEGFASGRGGRAHRHPCAALRRRRAAQPHPGGHRRAAALRRRPAGEAAGEGRGARRAVPDGHAHSSHLGARALRQSHLVLHQAPPPRQRAAHDAGALPRAAGRRLRGGPRGARPWRAGLRRLPARGQGRRGA